MLLWTPQSSRRWDLDGGTITQVSVTPDDGFGQWGIFGLTTGTAVKGKVGKFQGDAGDLVSYTIHEEWIVPNSGFGTVYVRLTDTGSFAATASTHAIDGTTWHALTEDSTNISFAFQYGGVSPRTCSTLVEISLNSGGTAIVASGTYNITCSATP